MEEGRLKIPYYQVAKQALMNWGTPESNWAPLSEEEAEKIINEKSFEEIENLVGAKGSMDYAIQEISKHLSEVYLKNHEEDIGLEVLSDCVYREDDDVETLHIMNKISNRVDTRLYTKADMDNLNVQLIMDTLFAVHDGWVKDNESKFMKKEGKHQLHQYMPSELIGWKEVKSDLLFVRPIFEKFGVEVDEAALEAEYNRRVKEFFLEHDIVGTDDVVSLVTQGKRFYPALEEYSDDVMDKLTDSQYVKDNVVPDIETKGIGNIENNRKSILRDITNDPNDADLRRLRPDELDFVNEQVNERNNELTKKFMRIQAQEKIIQDILQHQAEIKEMESQIEEIKNKYNGKNPYEF